MAPFNLRSLLLAAIFLSNCIGWTTSRRHFTHNVHGHRTRHRRNGAGLFLSASYVLPGGEGSGWGEWGEVSPCSRSCGGGVASQKRICLQIGPDGQPQCSGGDTKYFSCQTQDCPAGSKDFRALQCSEFDNKELNGGARYSSWVPYTKAPNPCELNCMPHMHRFYYSLKKQVVDGTRCNDESFDVCVNGTCQPVGCDMMLGSAAKEDKCRECRGNGANCHTTSGVLDAVDLLTGYNDMLLIPNGATNIIIAERRRSSNYLALHSVNGTYYLNGNYRIDFPRNLMIAGAQWNYERSHEGLPGLNRLRCLGPTNEPLYLSLLLQEENVGIDYEYSLPIGMASPQNKQYNWVYEKFTPCSTTCGGGFQTRTVSCRSREELELVDPGLCDPVMRPPDNQSCGTQPCSPRWVPREWGACSKRCGAGGTRSRDISCEKIITNGYPSIVSDKECLDSLGEKPPRFETCNENATCPTWFTGPWKPCNKLCDEGKQTRQVVCYQRNGRLVEVLNDALCESERPADEKPCLLQPCDGVDWVVSEWTGCDTCLSVFRTRVAVCATKYKLVVNDSFCSYHPTPSTREPCAADALPPCPAQWYATQWSNCSVECGQGTQSRKVFCGQFDGSSVVAVDDARCAGLAKYNDTKPCQIPDDQCPAQWLGGPWSACTSKCGGGQRYRTVMCLRGKNPNNDCDPEKIISSEEDCNTGPCNQDQVVPVSGDPSLLSDYDDCETFSEVGLDEESKSTTLEDLPLSDSPYTEDGSGWTVYDTDTSKTDMWFTLDGSGTGATETLLTDSTSEETTDDADEIFTEESTTIRALKDLGPDDDEPVYDTEAPNSSTSTDSDKPSTGSSETTETISTLPDISDATTESESTDATGIDSTSVSGVTEETEIDSTTESGSTEGTKTGFTTESGSTVGTEIGSTTVSDTTEETAIDSSTVSGTTEDTEIDSSTVSGTTEETETDSSTVSGTTEGTESDFTTVSDITTETGSTETTEVSSSSTSESDATIIDATTTRATNDLGPDDGEPVYDTESPSTETSDTTTGLTDLTSISSETDKETTYADTGSTTASGTTEETETDSSTVSGTTEETEIGSSTVSGSTEVTEVGSTTESGITEGTDIDTTTVSGTTEETETDSSTVSGTTEETETDSSTVSGTTEETESDFTTVAGVTTETGSTESTEPSSTLSSESDNETTSGSSDWTTTEESYTSVDLSSPAIEWTTAKKPRVCMPRICNYTLFGCCPDKKTTALGPFDQGCFKPDTCDKSKFGCCPDGLSPALGHKNQGCPVYPCNETLFGCCQSDNKTAAEGNDQEGCPPPPPACKSSKYGCCKDEETEATGPAKEGCPETTDAKTASISTTTPVYEGCDKSVFGCCYDNATQATGPYHQGCPCDTTEFGCCPDGSTPAEGPAFEGCLKSCNTSTHGCCPDGTTPAHGPNREGCCLKSAFGCCPDNYNYARGPHFEDCGCQYSRYGCCPDNVTSASGYDNKGCGCSYSPYGCCPDGHSEAAGPEFAGCGCHTYQFGCCPDGVTVARAPGGQGCQCDLSQFKCCGDGVTYATGPNQEGCDCSSSKFGCCPDGLTEATGSKFQGCTDAPVNKQAACGLKYERGPCRNYTVQWYYDNEYGGCSRFWYGGCEGNHNRFSSKEDCEDTCISPPPKDACKLPSSKGTCTQYKQHWYYDSERETCAVFNYGGCLGNDNRFDTRELCQKQCEPEKIADQCELEIAAGSCRGNFPRWGFNKESRKCEQFTWGGCEGNSNRFLTEAACLTRCHPPGRPEPECTQPQEAGNCSDTEALWAFSQSENRCVPFYYSGCGGNENKFVSVEECEKSCPSAYVPDKCTLAYEVGNCANYRLKWYFDTKDQSCRQFYYGGCGGNENSFMSEQECQNVCQPPPTTTQPPPTQPPPTRPPPTQPPHTQPPRQQPRPATQDRQEFCYFELDPGPCQNMTTIWGFDYRKNRCVTFQYGGCGGNRNNFPDESYCQYYCNVQDICQLPMQSGPCEESQMKWFYNSETDSCSRFTYGGCEGNGNRFESREDCESRCRTGPAEPGITTLATTTIAIDSGIDESVCGISRDLEACSEAYAGEVWFLGPRSRECEAYENAARGTVCRVTGVFRSQEACERSCGAFRGIDNICTNPLDAGPGQRYVLKYFFNATSDRCEQFAYSGSFGGPNRFSTELECTEYCKPVRDPCNQQPDSGNCLARYEQWYYDAGRDECYLFVWGGCGGNDNKFESREACEGRCRRRPTEVTTTTLSPVTPPDQSLVVKCAMPSSLEPCGESLTVFYYDSASRACRAAPIGNCPLANRYSTEEDCERNCGAFRGLDVCRTQLDPGPCGANVTKYYFDAATGECKQFEYGGCQGGPNRFSTLEECEAFCAEAGPAAACLAPVETGSACAAESSTRRWHYSAARADCLPFAYQGCGGNDNNFRSYEECLNLCNVIPPDVEAARCAAYDDQCIALEASCARMKETVAAEGCRRCTCEEPRCEAEQHHCSSLTCAYGVQRIREGNGCERCECSPDPCASARCADSQRCEATASRDPATLAVTYTAHCITDDDNEIPLTCEDEEQVCARLECPYGVRRQPTARGCTRCTCGPDPCGVVRCEPARERCVPLHYRDPITYEERYTAECRAVNKLGSCPVVEDGSRSTEHACQTECRDDADCGGYAKCCARGCSRLCLAPLAPTTLPPTTQLPITTLPPTAYNPDGPLAPQAPRGSVQTAPEVAAAEGGVATLRCIFHGNPPPRISWRFGEITIDSDRGRYRLLSDGALEIASLFRNDSGVYICLGENELGSARQEVTLQVHDPVEAPAGIAGEPNAGVVGELGRPLQVWCRAYGYPPPDVYWYRGLNGPMVLSDELYEARGQMLTIHQLTLKALGEYACLAYNGRGKPATLVVQVRAYEPDDNAVFPSHYLDPRNREVRITPPTVTTPPEIQYPPRYTVNKFGLCPLEEVESLSPDGECQTECRDDADCGGYAKCCARGCSRLCLAPVAPTTLPTTTQLPITTLPPTAYNPDGPLAPQAPRGSVQTAPEVAAAEGGVATLRCIFHGNPPPRISWRFGEITIDSDRGRYRLLSDGALEIASLFRNDSGVYICLGENELGSARQEVTLQVHDPVEAPAGIAGEPNAGVVGELGRPLQVWCRAYGYPPPDVYWYRGLNGPMVLSDELYEARGQTLTIHRLTLDTLGEYACLAYNGRGKPATWVVQVRAYEPDDNAVLPSRYLDPRDREVRVTPPTATTPEIQYPPRYTVRVETSLLPPRTTVAAGAELSLPCEASGQPEPTVFWTRDGARLAPSDRLWITGSRLTIPHAAVSDSGVYGCHASNPYSQHSSTVQITVQEIVIPATCTDSTFFANCKLIVQSKFCRHEYYSRFCCKSCVEAGQLEPKDVEMLGDKPYRRK